MDTPMSTASTLAPGSGSRSPIPGFFNGHKIADKSASKKDLDIEAVLASDSEKTDLQRIVPDNIVDWDGPKDPECPRNWGRRRKVCFVLVSAAMIVAVSFGSSVFAPAVKITETEFHEPLIVMQLTVALWVLGFCAGPIFFGPCSELFGHLLPYSVSMIGVAFFQLPIAMGNTLRTILVCRFFSGVFGSGVMAVVSGMYVELYEPVPRGLALGASAISINLGAVVAPIVGAYVTYDGPNASWRWTAWVTLIFCGFLGFLAIFSLRETSSRVILARKAKRLRYETGNWALHSRAEETRIEWSDIVHRYLSKPARMMATEPILIIFTIYLTLVYGILYLSFQAFPVAYQQRGWSLPTSELPFFAVMLGVFGAWAINATFTMTYYKKKVHTTDGPVPPEHRLPPMMAGAVILPPALLWFGWSGNVHWISQVIASFFIGLSLILIFICGIIYIVDVYQVHANSAISAHVVIRSIIACSFPLFASAMYNRLGIPWATSTLAFFCVALMPAPFVFYIFGKKIRSWSRFSFTL